MPKRVSLKGRGADIFFGDYTPPESPNPAGQAPQPPAPAPNDAAAQPISDAGVHARTRAPKRASTLQCSAPPSDAETSARVRTAMREGLHKKLQTKQRLASFTFRFRPEELDELDRVAGELNRTAGQKTSKNDLVRLALLWLLADYQESGDASVLAQVLART